MKTKLIPTQNNLPDLTRREIIELLNQQLADAIDLGLQAKQAHWNVKGPHFAGLHALFDQVAEMIEEFIDDLAERTVQLGGFALGTLQVVAKKSRLSAYSLTIYSGEEHVTEMSNALAMFGASIRAAIGSATKAGDADTADLLTEVSRSVDKLLWFVEVHLQAKE
jgi:starvation-inducible DNA-binding protein